MSGVWRSQIRLRYKARHASTADMANLLRTDAGASNVVALARKNSFEQFMTSVGSSIGDLVQAVLGSEAAGDVEAVVSGLDRCPAIRFEIRAWSYGVYLSARHKRAVGPDKLDDLAHIVDASYCAALLTNDRQQEVAARNINPGLRLLALDALL